MADFCIYMLNICVYINLSDIESEEKNGFMNERIDDDKGTSDLINIAIEGNDMAVAESKKSSDVNNTTQMVDLRNFLTHVQSKGLYATLPVRPVEEVVSYRAQNLISANREKIEKTLMDIQSQSKDENKLPLPSSIIRPTAAGAMYSLPNNAISQNAIMASKVANSGTGGDNELVLNTEDTANILEKQYESTFKRVVLSTGNTSSGKDMTSPKVSQYQQMGQRKSVRTPMGMSGVNNSDSLLFTPNNQSYSPSNYSESVASDNFNNNNSPEREYRQHSHSLSSEDIFTELQRATEQYRPQYTLTEGAVKRMKKLANTPIKVSEKFSFHNSIVLEPLESQVSMPLFMRGCDQ